MSNKYGISEKDEQEIRLRDKTCVYCHKKMINPSDNENRTDWATIEHLNFLPPWDDSVTVAICCFSCNASRGQKILSEWFKTEYCLERNINRKTVAEPVNWYLRLFENFIDKDIWIFAKTMTEIPHYYIVRDKLSDSDKENFDDLAELIVTKGKGEMFMGNEYKYLKLGSYKYWALNNIINRAKVE